MRNSDDCVRFGLSARPNGDLDLGHRVEVAVIAG